MPARPLKRWAPILSVLLCLSASIPAPAVEGDDRLHVIYFGNSFLENSVPWFHPTLARSAGQEMKVETHLGPGWQIWMHVNTFYTHPERSRRSLAEGAWDAVVIQHFGAHPLLKDNVRTSVFHNQEPFPEPRDVSDLASASAIIDLFLSGHPDHGRVLIYSSWPGIDGVHDFMRRVRAETEKSLVSEGLPREEVLKRVKERKPTLEEMLPLMRRSDYSAAWLAKYHRNDEVPFASKHFHSRDYAWQLMVELKTKYAKLRQDGRLALIPNGDVFLALDKKLRAGQMPGVENVAFFSRDGGHVRAGLPRYTLAATCFAVLFRKHPGVLDYSIYNDLKNYKTENLPQPGYVHQPDLGVLLEITPQRAKLVNDTVWEVVSRHPHCGILEKGTHR